MEPALLPGSVLEPLYILLEDCAALTPTQLDGLKKASCTTELMIGRPLMCVSIDPSWYRPNPTLYHKTNIISFRRPETDDIDYEIYCGWDTSPCYTQTRNNTTLKDKAPVLLS